MSTSKQNLALENRPNSSSISSAVRPTNFLLSLFSRIRLWPNGKKSVGEDHIGMYHAGPTPCDQRIEQTYDGLFVIWPKATWRVNRYVPEPIKI